MVNAAIVGGQRTTRLSLFSVLFKPRASVRMKNGSHRDGPIILKS